MAMHDSNSILKYVGVPVLALFLIFIVVSFLKGKKQETKNIQPKEVIVQNNASKDNAAESLNTLTSEVRSIGKDFIDLKKQYTELKNKNIELANQVNNNAEQSKNQIQSEINSLKNKIDNSNTSSNDSSYVINGATGAQVITTVNDLTIIPSIKDSVQISGKNDNIQKKESSEEKTSAIPFYTIPANATSVKDKLMTALVGRIPIKGVVVDPYPFKIVISDDNLAANGLRIPHLLQMIVSGYCEGDLVLNSVRGWITSLTFVFDDGTISNTTSNNNDIGNFTKSNSLGFLSDKYGNPFIPGKKFLTNAPTVVGVDAGLGAATGMANAYAQSQTTTSSSAVGGTSTTSVTGSQTKFLAGQALAGSTDEVKQWWNDRVSQSFDAVYVPPVDDNGCPIEIAVNFTKEIHIDYDKKGRKLSYENDFNASMHHQLD
jgi:hypothetical protein